MPGAGGQTILKKTFGYLLETHFLSHVQGTLLTGLSVPGIISFIFCTSCLYVLFRQTDRQTHTHIHTHTHTHTHESKFLRAGLLSCPLLSLYFEGCFCRCLLKGEKCLTYKISSKPKEKVSDPGKSGLFFGSFIQSHSFCKDMLKLSARQSVRQGWNKTQVLSLKEFYIIREDTNN